jgi:hypothetical protein
MLTVAYELLDHPMRHIYCRIWSPQTSTMVEEGVKRSEQREYYRTWISMQRENIRSCVSKLPGLRRSLRLDRDVHFDILDDYGMGSALVCSFRGGKFIWPKKVKEA